MMFQRLYQSCKTQIRYNTKVQAIDFSSDIVRVFTTNGQFTARKVISSLPLGVLKKGSVQFIPALPGPHFSAIKGIGNATMNKLFCLFGKPFWKKQEGFINFVTKTRKNRYPRSIICPNNSGKHILIFFIRGKASLQLGEWTDSKILSDLNEFLSNFIPAGDLDLREVKMTKWHKEEHSLGSYCYSKVGTTRHHFQQLRKPIESKVWFIGEHTHPRSMGTAHGAYETGLWAGNEVARSLRGVSVIEEEDSEDNERW